MANQYFINQTFTNEEILVTDSVRHHLFNVMRLQDGEKLELVFNDERIAVAEVTSASRFTIKVVKELVRNQELPIQVTIAVGFPKANKLEFIVEKATELGVSEVWAAPFEWSVVKWEAAKLTRKEEKLSKIAVSAAEQSKRNRIPKVRLFGNLSEIKKHFTDFDQVLVAYEESAKEGESSVLASTLLREKPKRLLILFGPEGGISPNEIAVFKAEGARLTGLGPRILRAETAPLYALAAISGFTELGEFSDK